MGINRARKPHYSLMTAGAAALVMLMTLNVATVRAASLLNSCTTYCHGMPPRDAARKANPHFGSRSSAFPGNHRNHLSTTPSAAECAICHKPVAASDFGHQNDVIVMANSLKGYSSATARARYDKGVFFNQTSIPNLANATCSNVSCHFEKKTPVWGSAAYAAPAGCGACHGSPPAGTVAAPGTAGSHARHEVFYPGIANCLKCHPAYTGFIHATSAGRPLKVQGFLRNPLNALEAGAVYTGTGANYLPSKSASQLFGSCSNLYCHSSGQNPATGGSGATYKTLAWGSPSLTCAGCHVDEATDATGTGSHRLHTMATGANYDCAVCHQGSTKTTVATATHVNGLIELGAAGFTYSQGSGAAHPAANGYGTCSASTCHGQGAPAWGATSAAPVNGFPFSASQCAKCHSGTLATDVTAANPFYGTAIPKVTLNTNARVGAHTSHVVGVDSLSSTVTCAGCHGTVTLTATTHMNGVANFTWSTLATKGGTIVPTYTAATGVCATVYCHGASMPGGDTSGSNRAPVWNSSTYLPATIGAGGAACKTCHGFPPLPASGHPALTTAVPATFGNGAVALGPSCSCHANVSATGTTYANIFVNKALHINGVMETPASGHSFPYGGSLHLSAAGTTPWAGCIGCHATTVGGVYPVAAGTAPNCTGCHINGLRAPSGSSSCWDCHGVSATNGLPNGTTFPNIAGSHALHAAITGTTCATCHTGGGAGTATHGSGNRVAATAASVRVAFTGQGTAPLWTLATKTCSATNCHGQGAPAWGATSAAPVNGFPFSASQCAKCHSGTLATDVTAANPFYGTAIPKVTLNTNARVGAHTSHVAGVDSLSSTVTCAGCHGTVTLTATTHMNGVANFTWSTLATKGGTIVPSYNAATGVCATVYCHGASMPGGDTSGSNRAPVWNSSTYLPATIGAGGAACKTCHGFPPLPASGHPALTTAVPATFGNGAVALGPSCNCHANVSATGTTYATIFVNKALHINGIMEVSGGHAVPYDTHKAAVVAAGGNTACLGCHAMGTAASVYPATGGAAPHCMSCHRKAAPVHTGTVAGANCSSCHGLSTATTYRIGRPVGTAYPDRLGFHGGAQDGDHGTAACTVCHSGAGTTSGNNSGINHGKGSTAGPVRNGKPNVVGPMATGITPVNSAKGVGIPAGGTTCNHNSISGCSGGGTKSNSW